LSQTEQAIWELSNKINTRGFCIDRAFAEAARKIAQQAAPEIDQEIQKITGGNVTTINQVARLAAWQQDHGCRIQKLDKKTIQRQLEKGDDELSAPVRRVLELRLGGAQAAVRKLLHTPTLSSSGIVWIKPHGRLCSSAAVSFAAASSGSNVTAYSFN
jgi:hypothetical protein